MFVQIVQAQGLLRPESNSKQQGNRSMFKWYTVCNRTTGSGVERKSSIDRYEKRGCYLGKQLPAICLANICFWGALNYKTHSFNEKSSHYHDEVARNVYKSGKFHRFQWSRKFWFVLPVSIISFQYEFHFACNTNGVHGSAAIWLLHFLWNPPPVGHYSNALPLDLGSITVEKELRSLHTLKLLIICLTSIPSIMSLL